MCDLLSCFLNDYLHISMWLNYNWLVNIKKNILNPEAASFLSRFFTVDSFFKSCTSEKQLWMCFVQFNKDLMS